MPLRNRSCRQSGAAALVVMYVADHGRTGKVRAVVHETGEQYRVDCPFCFDQGQNLYVSYAYGQCDPNTGSDNYRQWHCKNARCHKDKECCARLREHTAIRFCYVARELAAANASGEHVNGSPLVTAPIPSLPEAVLFNDLREDHPAWAYLKARGFYPSHLSSGWGVGYCHHSVDQPDAIGRIIVPVLGLGNYKLMNLRSQLEGHGQQFTLAGWQALAVGDPQDGQPACVISPGLDLTKQLYGIRQAVNSNGPVFVCEGVTDCWRIGTGANGT